MHDRLAFKRTDYEQSRPAPHPVASLVAAVVLPAVVVAALAAPAVVAAAVIATPVVARAAVAVRRRRPRALARAAVLRVEPLLPAALQR